MLEYIHAAAQKLLDEASLTSAEAADLAQAQMDECIAGGDRTSAYFWRKVWQHLAKKNYEPSDSVYAPSPIYLRRNSLNDNFFFSKSIKSPPN